MSENRHAAAPMEHHELLLSLLAGEWPSLPALPPVPDEVDAFLRGDSPFEEIPAAQVAQGLGSPAGPLLLPLSLPHLRGETLWSAVLLLCAPPLRLRRVLVALRRSAHVDAGLRAAVMTRLEGHLAALPAVPAPPLRAHLGLPASLGAIVDELTLAIEAGAPTPGPASAATPLALTCETLGVRSPFELLPAARGELRDRAGAVPLEVLHRTIEGLNLIGAAATATRLLVFALLLNDPTPEIEPQRLLLRRLLTSSRARIPADRVVDTWSLVNR